MNSGSIPTKLTYVREPVSELAIYNYRPGPDDPDLSGQYEEPAYLEYPVKINDIRGAEQSFSLDEAGFAVVAHVSAVENYYDEAQVRSIYMAEVEALVQRVTGALRVHAFDYNVRCQAYSEQKIHMARSPVRFVHNDYTDASGPQRLRDLMGAEAEALLKNRYAVINVWKPMVGPVLRTPLAVCDARSIGTGDLIDTSLLYRDRTGKIQLAAYRPEHRWYYLSNMQADEALLLKCFDSERDGRVRFTAHTAFDFDVTPEQAPDRQSIEVRTLAFF